MKEPFENVWMRIVDNQGEKFNYKRKKGTFSYKIEGEKFIPLVPDKVPEGSNKDNLRKAYEEWPKIGPGAFSTDIFATSYVWGVLNDSRIISK